VAKGFSHVASLPVDSPTLPADWLAKFGDGPAHAADQPLIAVWPVALADGLEAFVAGGGRRVREWVAGTGARAVDLGPLANLNQPGDLDRLRR
jgi:molybdopterin-guanine dinucleotide biosynthesis protein A